MEKYNKIAKAVLHVVIVLYGLSMVFLFYKQTGWTGGERENGETGTEKSGG